MANGPTSLTKSIGGWLVGLQCPALE